MHRPGFIIGPVILLELGFLLCFFNEGYTETEFNEWGFAVTSVLIGVIFAALFWRVRVDVGAQSTPQPIVKTLTYLMMISGIVLFCGACRQVFLKMPISAHASDVIPTIEIAVKRFLQGERVYQTVHFDSYSLPLTYLPMTWLPYTIAELGGFDYRWISVGICCLASIIVVVRCSRRSAWLALLVTMLLWMSGILLLEKDPGIIGMSVELMIAGYYMLLIIGLGSRSPWICGLTIAICLLSRFSLVLWLPLWAVTQLLTDRRYAVKAFAAIAIPLLLLYIIPFLSHDWSYFFKAVGSYTNTALGHWNRYVYDGHQSFFKRGVGFAGLFADKLHSYSVADRLRSLQKVQLALCIGFPVAAGVWYWLRGRKILDARVFLLATFKIYLTLFLCFVHMPFMYLMITSVAVSVAMLAETARYGTNRP